MFAARNCFSCTATCVEKLSCDQLNDGTSVDNCFKTMATTCD